MKRKRRLAILELIAEDPQAPYGDRIRAIELLEKRDSDEPAYDADFYASLEQLSDAALERELEAFDVPTARERPAVDREIRRIEEDPDLLRAAVERAAVRAVHMRQKEQSGPRAVTR